MEDNAPEPCRINQGNVPIAHEGSIDAAGEPVQTEAVQLTEEEIAKLVEEARLRNNEQA